MSDLVEKLRKAESNIGSCYEAADTIERLRAALECINEHSMDAAEIARKALNPDD